MKTYITLGEGDLLSEVIAPDHPQPVDVGFDPYRKVELTRAELRSESRALNRNLTRDREYSDF